MHAPAILHRRRRISVLIPAYNHAGYIAETLASVLAQDWPDLELLILDDGSTDATLAVAEQTLSGERRVHVRIAHQPNAGISATQNRLMAMADGDVLAILNSDDRYAPRRLTTMMQHIGDTKRFFAFSRIAAFASGGADDAPQLTAYYNEVRDKAETLPTLGFALLLANIAVSSSNFVFSRDLVELTGGFAPSLPMTQDWDFALRCLHVVEPLMVPESLLAYRLHPGNTWRAYAGTRIGESEAVLRGYFSWRGPVENPLAPSSAAWPRYFPLFLSIARPGFAREGYADLLRRFDVHPNWPRLPGAPDSAMEQQAILRFIASTLRAS